MAVAGEITRHGWAHLYSWLVTIVSLSGLESDEMKHRSEWKPNFWGMFLDTGVSTRQVHASHTSIRYNVYVRPRGITRNFLVVLCHFWHCPKLFTGIEEHCLGKSTRLGADYQYVMKN